MSRGKLYKLLFGLSLAGYLWVGWNMVEGTGSAATPEVCLFKAVTHLPCPSCGTTRALEMLMSGDVRGSLFENPFGILLALALIVVPLWLVADMFRKSESLLRWYVRGERLLSEHKWISIPAIALVIVNWVWNIAKGL